MKQTIESIVQTLVVHLAPKPTVVTERDEFNLAWKQDNPYQVGILLNELLRWFLTGLLL